MIQSIAHFTVSIVALNNRQVYKKCLLKIIANIVTRAFSDRYFPVYGQSHTRIFPYWDRIRESDQIWENTDTIPSIYGKIWIMESPHFGIFNTVESSCKSFDFYYSWRLKACNATVNCLSTFENNSKQSSNKSRFYREKALQKTYCKSS